MGRKRKDVEVEDDEIEKLQKEIRELKSINRALLKRLKKLDRNYEESLDREEETKYKEHVVHKNPACHHCGKGQLIDVDLAGRIFQRCDTCDFRSKTRKK